MTPLAPPLCVNCLAYERIKTPANPLYSISQHICHRTFDLVTGDALAEPAGKVRGPDGWCGRDGILFEAYTRADADA